MIKITDGNLLTAEVEALVNTVNTEGVMGKGIALQFKLAYPGMFKAYEVACKNGEVKLGEMHVFDLGGLVDGHRWIINFPTKGHWRSRSRLEDIVSGLKSLVATIEKLGIKSIAIPPLGCGNGGLAWDDVRPLIEKAFQHLPNVDVLVFPPSGAPDAKVMPIRTTRPKITPGRAALISMMERYQAGLLDPFMSLLEIHKLMYFLQEAGQPLRLKYEAKLYGPYASNLRQVLIHLEGHYIEGYGDGIDSPTKKIGLKPGASEAAKEELHADSDLMSRIIRVYKLIEGYEDPYGLELLSSMHWVLAHYPDARESVDRAVELVHSWNPRKRKILKAVHLRSAWERLRDQRWDEESASSVH
ncbi:macro domain-containing protein [Massilia sp. 9096]|uniref:type II toxin-antitoxin system antitoxin DNA ADP-ribosyl glycohydrolase DarG n=1 Tax=Massilia sp. 9096 TaxID=1500894 RepID=UPI0005660AD8|nr:macro domain-containing protein [Massilia sp. 9096]